MIENKDKIYRSMKKVEKWVEDRNYKGYEPFDGLLSVFRPWTFNSLLLDRILMQLVRQSPINIRPLLVIRPQDSTIGRGYMAWGYLANYRSTKDPEYLDKARNCLKWLSENKSPGYDDLSWGKHFDFASRGGRYPKFMPITVWTSLIGMAFLEAYEITAEKRYLIAAESICSWIMALSRKELENGICLSYTGSGEQEFTIHNHNMLAAAMLARTGKHTNKTEYFSLAKSIMNQSCSAQLPDGGWYYGETPSFHWIDNFHTGYNLDSLKCYIESSGDNEYQGALRLGFEYYKSRFFEESGRPKYYHNRTYPVDSQCISQSIETLAYFSDSDPAALDLSIKVATWAIDNMQNNEGFFYYRQYPFIKAKTPMLHWAQATTYRAFALLFSRLVSHSA